MTRSGFTARSNTPSPPLADRPRVAARQVRSRSFRASAVLMRWNTATKTALAGALIAPEPPAIPSLPTARPFKFVSVSHYAGTSPIIFLRVNRSCRGCIHNWDPSGRVVVHASRLSIGSRSRTASIRRWNESWRQCHDRLGLCRYVAPDRRRRPPEDFRHGRSRRRMVQGKRSGRGCLRISRARPMTGVEPVARLKSQLAATIDLGFSLQSNSAFSRRPRLTCSP